MWIQSNLGNESATFFLTSQKDVKYMVDTEQSGRYISDHPLFKELKCANPNNISSGYNGGYIVGRSQKVPNPKVPVLYCSYLDQLVRVSKV